MCPPACLTTDEIKPPASGRLAGGDGRREAAAVLVRSRDAGGNRTHFHRVAAGCLAVWLQRHSVQMASCKLATTSSRSARIRTSSGGFGDRQHIAIPWILAMVLGKFSLLSPRFTQKFTQNVTTQVNNAASRSDALGRFTLLPVGEDAQGHPLSPALFRNPRS